MCVASFFCCSCRARGLKTAPQSVNQSASTHVRARQTGSSTESIKERQMAGNVSGKFEMESLLATWILRRI